MFHKRAACAQLADVQEAAPAILVLQFDKGPVRFNARHAALNDLSRFEGRLLMWLWRQGLAISECVMMVLVMMVLMNVLMVVVVPPFASLLANCRTHK